MDILDERQENQIATKLMVMLLSIPMLVTAVVQVAI